MKKQIMAHKLRKILIQFNKGSLLTNYSKGFLTKSNFSLLY